MATIKEYLDYAELAQAAYGIGYIPGTYLDNEGKNILTDPQNEVHYSTTQAENFAKRYKVLATSAEYGIGNISSFDAVLFLDTQTGKKVMAIRGSQEVMDYALDAALGVSGLIYGQNVSLNNFYDALVADNKLSVVEKIDVTGHSLGGYLAQLFTAEHPYVVNDAYTYNAPGIGGLNQESQELFGLQSPSDYNNKITNLYAEDGSEFVAGLGVMLGEIVPLSIDPDSLDANNHRIGRLTESLHIYNMLSSIANTQDLNLLTSILENTSNEKAINIVSDVFQYAVYGSVVDKAIALTEKWSGDAMGLTSLMDETASKLQSKRVENIYALLNSNPFVIEGDYLPAYANINPADYSDMYMKDRADYMYYILDKDARYGGGIGKDSYIAFDSYGVHLDGKTGNQVIFGTDYYNNSYQLKGGAGDDRIYGLGGDDELVGGAGYDYMEGGTGDDTVSGGADNDTLFGDSGNDILYGNTDDDTLLGGEGHDALFGGSGEDVLLGESGDDTLAGGDASNLYADKELDYLAGGVGHDIYYVSHQDIINDADSTGFIMFNSKSLSGTKTKVDEYTYEDANFTYTLNGPNMIVVDKNLGEYITIENMNFNNASGMGMEFDDGSETDPNKKDIEIYVGDATVTEGGTLEFTIGIDNTLDEDLVVNVSSYWSGSANSSDLSGTTNGTITIKAGTTHGTFEIATFDDTIVEPTENFIFAVTGLAEAYADEILINNNLHVDMKEVA